jgi:hypothetical protein
MTFARMGKLFLVALVGGAAYWVYRTRPTVSGFVDDITQPLFRSKAAVEESEHKRVVAEAAPAAGRDEEVAIGTLREKMTGNEVRSLIGPPDETEEFREDGVMKMRWTYRRLGRVLVLRDNRVVSITVR